jgi:ABC-type nitrate/sulfonate/bicarbonate transport system ATPase subunit
LDEPFSSLDTALKIRIARVFAQLWKEEKRTAVFVTHDLEEALMLGHRIILLKGGKIACDIRLDDKQIPRDYGASSVEKEKLLSFLL